MPKNDRPKIHQLVRGFLFFAFAFSVGYPISRADWLPDEILNYPQEARFVEYQATKLAERLEQAGLEEIAAWQDQPAINVKELKAQLSTIEYIQVENFFKPPGASRWTAFHEFGQRRVFVNSGARLDSLVSDALAFHEALGALGYAEPDYQVSILATLYANTARDVSLREEQRKQALASIRKLLGAPLNFTPDPNPQNRILLSRSGQGGGDIVGGGGDGDALSFKLQLLEKIEIQADPGSKVKRAAQVAKLPIDIVEKTSSPVGVELADPAILRIERARFELSRGGIQRLSFDSFRDAEALLRAKGLIDGP